MHLAAKTKDKGVNHVSFKTKLRIFNSYPNKKNIMLIGTEANLRGSLF